MPARRSAPSVPTCPCSSPCSEATRRWHRGSAVRADCRGSSASRRSAPSRCRSSRCAGSTYWIARHAAGHLAGFVALWDQQQLKHTVVQRYALRAALFRYGFNLAAPLVGSPRLPAPGTPLRYLSAFHVCVPATDPGVLRALLVKAARAHAGSPYAFCSIGLDVTDPLTSALAGCWAQTTLVHAHVGTPEGAYDGPPLGARPLHFETALV